MTGPDRPVVVVANHGDVAGGEEMALRVAEAVRSLGREVLVVGPRSPGEFVARATALGLPTEAVTADDRRGYLLALVRAARGWSGLVWTHGLLPALATTGRRRRIVHLHQPPAPAHRALLRVARLRATVVVAPSDDTARRVGALTVPNWTGPLLERPVRPRPEGPHRIGFLGRCSQDKGLDVLARAVADLDARSPGSVRLVVAGDDRHVPTDQRTAVAAALADIGHLVERVGWVPRDRLLDDVDLLAVPSVWPEPFGLVAAEALGTGVPLVVSDAGALPEVVGSDHPWIARRGDADHLADVLERALRSEPADSLTAGQSRWAECYSPAAGASRVASLLARSDP